MAKTNTNTWRKQKKKNKCLEIHNCSGWKQITGHGSLHYVTNTQFSFHLSQANIEFKPMFTVHEMCRILLVSPSLSQWNHLPPAIGLHHVWLLLKSKNPKKKTHWYHELSGGKGTCWKIEKEIGEYECICYYYLLDCLVDKLYIQFKIMLTLTPNIWVIRQFLLFFSYIGN